jgi:hypothetical protein
MLLVLISLMMATILSVSYLASRDNSAIIGENIASSAAARWGTASALELGVAILQTEANWREAPDGLLLDAIPLAGALATVTVTDLATNQPPTETSEYVELTAVSTVNGVEQVATAEAFVPATTSNSVDIDLSEFAIFATSRIEVGDRSVVTRWPNAPLSQLGRRLAFGTRAVAAGSVRIDPDAAAIDTTVYHGPSASGALVSVGGSQMIGLEELSDQIPIPDAPHWTISEDSTGAPDVSLTGANVNVSGAQRVGDVDLSGSTMTFADGTVYVAEGHLQMTGSKLRINGSVTIVVLDDADLTNSSIELQPGGEVRVALARSVDLNNSYMGDVITGAGPPDASGNSPYMNPARLEIYGLDNNSMENWDLNGTSVIKGVIYSPPSRVRIGDTSAVYGRVAAGVVELNADAALFYDPALDSRRGYTSQSSLLFENDGDVVDAFAELDSLDALDVAAAAEMAGVIVLATDNGTDMIVPDGVIADADPPPMVPGQPTPRPVIVDYWITSLGSNMREWESQVE